MGMVVTRAERMCGVAVLYQLIAGENPMHRVGRSERDSNFRFKIILYSIIFMDIILCTNIYVIDAYFKLNSHSALNTVVYLYILSVFPVPICMPSDAADFTGRMATVTGWGRLKYGGGVPSVLQEVQVRSIRNCSRAMKIFYYD